MVLCPLSSCSAAAHPESPGASPSPPNGTTISTGGVHAVHISCLFGLVHFTVESSAQCDEVRICLSLYLPASRSSDVMLSSCWC